MASELPPFPPFRFTKNYHHTLYPAIDPTNALLSAHIKGKVVLVTGGGRGLGKVIAKSFALAGARSIVLLGRTTSTLKLAAEEIQALSTGTLVRTIVGDILNREALIHAVQSARAEIGPIDIFISNAGDFYGGRIVDSDADEYWRSIEINLKGTLNCVQVFLQHGISSDQATPTFINLSTVGIHLQPHPGMSAYAVSKIGAYTMLRFLQAEMEGQLRVFSIHPGTVATDMAAKAGVPVYDDAELAGGFCVWLAATKGADFLQGRLLWANWDVDELLQMKSNIVDKDMLNMVLGGWAK
jgi:NAD(P)-dependent dehydrogenase (short-subunit alcohol dehydrogenase family)